MGIHAKKLFSEKDLKIIADTIGEVESSTSGEVRVSIRQKRRWGEKKLSIEQLARMEFHNLGMTQTRDRTGVLIFLLLQERQFYILADEGIHTKVEEGTWQNIANEISTQFAQQHFFEGIIKGIRSVGEVLAKNFPRKSDDKNELPNSVTIS